jgi:cold shock CspA family protein
MARKFITEREIAFINRINHELIQNVVGQELMYYQILPEQTHTNDLYNEAIRKTWAPPVKINGLMMWDNSTTTFTNITADSKYSLDVYFHTQEIQERNVLPKEGDFVEFGHVFFEITSVTQPQIVFGQINNRIMTKCVCVPSREGQFQAGNNSSENVDHTHQVETPQAINK